MSKICSRCELSKDESEFGFQNKILNKRMSACKSCMNDSQRLDRKFNPDKIHLWDREQYKKNRLKRIESAREYRRKYPDRTKNTNLKAKYGISLEDYNKLLELQNHSCAICHIKSSLLKRALCVDHNHETGKVRGLLCDDCNKGLGFYEIRGMIYEKYLERFRGI